MTSRIISLDEYRRTTQTEKPSVNQDFQLLFSFARDLRALVPECPAEEIMVADWKGTERWLGQEIAKEVFAQKLFARSILISITYVATLLVEFIQGKHEAIGIEEHLDTYTASGDPQAVLRAANSAFLLFVFWPEQRANRLIQYRQYAEQLGPPLFANYAGISKRPYGYDMAEAFVPLGTISRDRFVRA